MIEDIVYWPPKSKKQFNYYISNWVDPDINWLKFQLKKVHLDMATKDICDICINIHTETSSYEIEKTGNFLLISFFFSNVFCCYILLLIVIVYYKHLL